MPFRSAAAYGSRLCGRFAALAGTTCTIVRQSAAVVALGDHGSGAPSTHFREADGGTGRAPYIKFTGMARDVSCEVARD